MNIDGLFRSLRRRGRRGKSRERGRAAGGGFRAGEKRIPVHGVQRVRTVQGADACRWCTECIGDVRAVSRRAVDMIVKDRRSKGGSMRPLACPDGRLNLESAMRLKRREIVSTIRL